MYAHKVEVCRKASYSRPNWFPSMPSQCTNAPVPHTIYDGPSDRRSNRTSHRIRVNIILKSLIAEVIFITAFYWQELYNQYCIKRWTTSRCIPLRNRSQASYIAVPGEFARRDKYLLQVRY